MILILYSELKHEEPISRACWESIDAVDRERAFSISLVADRKRFVAGRYLLRRALSQVLQEDPASFAFRVNPEGKPLLLNGPCGLSSEAPLDFNISHSAHAVAAVVSTEGRVGLDLELSQPLNIESIEAAFSQKELASLNSLPPSEREKACLEAWTEKEAVAKLLGCVDKLDFNSMPRVQSGGNELCALRSWSLDLGAENYQLCLAFEGSKTTEILLQKETA